MSLGNLFGKIGSDALTTARKRARADHRRDKILTTDIANVGHSYTIIQSNIYTSILRLMKSLKNLNTKKIKNKN
jgi:hypothetical protein